MKISALVVLASVVVASLAVSAQDTGASTIGYTLIGDTVDGTTVGPDGTPFLVRGNAKFDSLIEIRRSFYNETLESADEFVH